MRRPGFQVTVQSAVEVRRRTEAELHLGTAEVRQGVKVGGNRATRVDGFDAAAEQVVQSTDDLPRGRRPTGADVVNLPGHARSAGGQEGGVNSVLHVEQVQGGLFVPV